MNLAQRGSQIVGDGISKSFQLLIGSGQFGGPVQNSLLQFNIQLADLLLRALTFGDFRVQGCVRDSQFNRSLVDPNFQLIVRLAQPFSLPLYLRGFLEQLNKHE